MFRYKSLRKTTILLCLLDVSVTLLFYAPSMMMDKFHLGIFVNGWVIEGSLLLSSIFSCYMVTYFPRVKAGIVSFSVVLAASIGLTFVWDQNNYKPISLEDSIWVLVLLFLFMFAITAELCFFALQLYEIYPTQVRIVGSSVAWACGTTILTFLQLLISFFLNSGISIMAFFGFSVWSVSTT